MYIFLYPETHAYILCIKPNGGAHPVIGQHKCVSNTSGDQLMFKTALWLCRGRSDQTVVLCLVWCKLCGECLNVKGGGGMSWQIPTDNRPVMRGCLSMKHNTSIRWRLKEAFVPWSQINSTAFFQCLFTFTESGTELGICLTCLNRLAFRFVLKSNCWQKEMHVL